MAITLAQASVSTNSGASSVTSQQATYGSAVTTGSLLVACVGTVGGSNPISGVADSVNGSWALDGSYTVDGGIGYGIAIYSKANTASGTPVVTVTQTSAACSLTILEFAGVATVSPVDTTGNAIPGSSLSPISTSLTTTQANDLIVAIVDVYNNTHSPAAGSGYTSTGAQVLGGTGSDVLVEYKLDAGASGSKTVDFSFTGTANPILTAIAYKIAAAAGTVTYLVGGGVGGPSSVIG